MTYLCRGVELGGDGGCQTGLIREKEGRQGTGWPRVGGPRLGEDGTHPQLPCESSRTRHPGTWALALWGPSVARGSSPAPVLRRRRAASRKSLASFGA